jgi:PHD/YefM family antitoxin component YafN of YafNO toxin-antitoxin module
MDQMSPEELKLKIDQLMDKEHFPPIAVMRDGKPRLVVVPYEAYRSSRSISRERIAELSEQEIKVIGDSKEHLDEERKDD